MLECLFIFTLIFYGKVALVINFHISISFVSIEAHYIQRELPSSLKEGEPNLLLVPKGRWQNTRFQSSN